MSTSVMSSAVSHISPQYFKIRDAVGRRFVLEGIVRKYLPRSTAEDAIIRASRLMTERLNTLVTKKSKIDDNFITIQTEDLCVAIAFLAALPFVLVVIYTGYWRWAIEIYTCLYFPAMVSFRALEAGQHDKVSHLLGYWVFMGGLLRIFESLIDFRTLFPKYILLKSFLSMSLTHPKLDGMKYFSQFIVTPYILPRLGTKSTKKVKVVEMLDETHVVTVTTPQLSLDENIGDAEPALVEESEDAEPALVEESEDAEPALVKESEDAESSLVEYGKDVEAIVENDKKELSYEDVTSAATPTPPPKVEKDPGSQTDDDESAFLPNTATTITTDGPAIASAEAAISTAVSDETFSKVSSNSEFSFVDVGSNGTTSSDGNSSNSLDKLTEDGEVEPSNSSKEESDDNKVTTE